MNEFNLWNETMLQKASERKFHYVSDYIMYDKSSLLLLYSPWPSSLPSHLPLYSLSAFAILLSPPRRSDFPVWPSTRLSPHHLQHVSLLGCYYCVLLVGCYLSAPAATWSMLQLLLLMFRFGFSFGWLPASKSLRDGFTSGAVFINHLLI